MLKDAGPPEEVHLTAAMTIIRSRKIKREFTIRSTLLLKQISYLLIRAAAFLLLLHTKFKKNVKEDQKVKEEFVRENLQNHPRNVIKRVDLVNQERVQNHPRNVIKRVDLVNQERVQNHLRNVIKRVDLVNQERAPFLEKKLVQKVAKNILNLKVANQKNLNVLKNFISLVKNQILIKKEEI